MNIDWTNKLYVITICYFTKTAIFKCNNGIHPGQYRFFGLNEIISEIDCIDIIN